MTGAGPSRRLGRERRGSIPADEPRFSGWPLCFSTSEGGQRGQRRTAGVALSSLVEGRPGPVAVPPGVASASRVSHQEDHAVVALWALIFTAGGNRGCAKAHPAGQLFQRRPATHSTMVLWGALAFFDNSGLPRRAASRELPGWCRRRRADAPPGGAVSTSAPLSSATLSSAPREGLGALQHEVISLFHRVPLQPAPQRKMQNQASGCCRRPDPRRILFEERVNSASMTSGYSPQYGTPGRCRRRRSGGELSLEPSQDQHQEEAQRHTQDHDAPEQDGHDEGASACSGTFRLFSASSEELISRTTCGHM